MDPRLSWASNVDAPRVPLDLARMLIMIIIMFMIMMLMTMTTMKKMVTRQGGSVCTQYGRGLPPRVVESPRPRHKIMIMTMMMMMMMSIIMMMMSIMMMVMMMVMVLSHLIFDVKVGSGLAENLNDAREAVPGRDVETGLFVLSICRDHDDGDHDGDNDDESDNDDADNIQCIAMLKKE